MFARRRMALALISILSVSALISCGGGSASPTTVRNVTGSFTNADLNGTYAFALTGTNSFGFFTAAGTLQADGKGNIASGIEDFNSGSGVFTNVALTGTYNVGADGRGTATLNSSVNTITLDFVIVSSRRALIIRFDRTASGNGSLDLQDSSASSTAALHGPFALSLSGIDSSQNSFQAAGSLNLDGAGNVTAGILDSNDGGATSLNQPFTGSYSVAGNGRGTLALNTSSATLNFAFYVVDSTHLKLVEIDSSPVFSGDAFLQQGAFSNASVSGQYAFTLGGSAGGPFAAGGVFSADGAGAITSGVQDINRNGGVGQNISLSGSYSVAPNGRGTFTINSNAGTAHFVVYPSSGGLLMLQTDSSTTASGTAFRQPLTGFAPTTIQGNYGMILSGFNNSGEIDAIAQVSADGNGRMTGAIDINNNGLAQDFALVTTYSVGANGRGTATLRSSFGTQNIAFYVVSGTQVLFVEVDSSQVGLGVFEHQ